MLPQQLNLMILNQSSSRQSLQSVMISNQNLQLISKSEWSSRVVEKEQRELEKLERILEAERQRAKDKFIKEQELLSLQEQKSQLAQRLKQEKEKEIAEKNNQRFQRQKQNEQTLKEQFQSQRQALDKQSVEKQKMREDERAKQQNLRDQEFKRKQLVIKEKKDAYLKELEQQYLIKQTQLDQKEKEIELKLSQKRAMQLEQCQQKQQEQDQKLKASKLKRSEQEQKQKQNLEERIQKGQSKLIEIERQRQKLKEELKQKQQQKEQDIQKLLEDYKNQEEERKKELMRQNDEEEYKIQQKKLKHQQEMQEIRSLERQLQDQKKKVQSQKLQSQETERKSQILDKIQRKQEMLQKVRQEQQYQNEIRQKQEDEKRQRIQEDIQRVRLQQDQAMMQQIREQDDIDLKFNLKREEEKQIKQQVMYIKENLSIRKQAIVSEIKQLRENFRTINNDNSQSTQQFQYESQSRSIISNSLNGGGIGYDQNVSRINSRNGSNLSVITEQVRRRKRFNQDIKSVNNNINKSVIHQSSEQNPNSSNQKIEGNYDSKKKLLQMKLDSLLSRNFGTINSQSDSQNEQTIQNKKSLINIHLTESQDSLTLPSLVYKSTILANDKSIKKKQKKSVYDNDSSQNEIRASTKSSDFRKVKDNSISHDNIQNCNKNQNVDQLIKKNRRSDQDSVFKTYLNPKAFQEFKKRLTSDRKTKPSQALKVINLLNNQNNPNKNDESKAINKSISDINIPKIDLNKSESYAGQTRLYNQSHIVRNDLQKIQSDQILEDAMKSRRQSPRVNYDPLINDAQEHIHESRNIGLNTQSTQKSQQGKEIQSQLVDQNKSLDTQQIKRQKNGKAIDQVNIYHSHKANKLILKPIFIEKNQTPIDQQIQDNNSQEYKKSL